MNIYASAMGQTTISLGKPPYLGFYDGNCSEGSPCNKTAHNNASYEAMPREEQFHLRREVG